RLNSNFTFDQARLDALSFSFSENNLAGRNKTASVNFALDPGRYAVGLGYLDPRVWGSRHFARAVAGVYLARDGSRLEGGNATVEVGRPLFSLHTRWAWDAQVQYIADTVRFFRGGDLALFNFNKISRPFKHGDDGV